MYKIYLKHGKVHFFKRGIELNGIVYGIYRDADIHRIKSNVVKSSIEYNEKYDLEPKIEQLAHTDIVFEQPTTEQLSVIQGKNFENPQEARKFVDEVMNDTYMPSQEEINAMLMLEIAKLKAGANNE